MLQARIGWSVISIIVLASIAKRIEGSKRLEARTGVPPIKRPFSCYNTLCQRKFVHVLSVPSEKKYPVSVDVHKCIISIARILNPRTAVDEQLSSSADVNCPYFRHMGMPEHEDVRFNGIFLWLVEAMVEKFFDVYPWFTLRAAPNYTQMARIFVIGERQSAEDP